MTNCWSATINKTFGDIDPFLPVPVHGAVFRLVRTLFSCVLCFLGVILFILLFFFSTSVNSDKQ